MLNASSQISYTQYGKAALSFIFTTGSFLLMKSAGIFWSLGAEAAETPSFNENSLHQLERMDAFAVQPNTALERQSNLPAVTDASIASDNAGIVNTDSDFRIIDISDSNNLIEIDANEVGTVSREEKSITLNAKQKRAIGDEFQDISAKRNLQASKKRTFLGNEFRLNSVTANGQRFPSVVGSNNGVFLAAWRGFDGPGDNGIYGRVFDNAGNTVSGEFKVSTYTPNTQDVPVVATLENGNFVCVWYSILQDGSGWSVYGQLIDPLGNKINGEFKVNTYSNNQQAYQHVAGLADGNFVVVWHGEGTENPQGVYAQIFDPSAAKIGSQFLVNNNITFAGHPAVDNLDNGNFVVVWREYDGDSYGIHAQFFTKIGIKIGNKFQVNTYTVDAQHYASVAGLTNNNFVITWVSYEQDGSDDGIYGQLFDENANIVGNEFQVNTYTQGRQGSDPASITPRRTAPFPNGGFIVVWTSNGQDSSGYGIYAQVFNNAATKIGPEFRLNSYVTNAQKWPSVAALSNNNIVVAWTSDWQDGSGDGVYAQIISGNLIASNLNQNLTYTVDDTMVNLNDIVVSESPSDSVIATLMFYDPQMGYLSISSAGASTSTYNAAQGIWQASGLIADVNALLGAVSYVPLSNFRKSFTIDLNITDEVNVPLTGTISMISDSPEIINNNFTITEGETLIITDHNLSSYDPNSNSTITFTISNLMGGQFEFVNNTGIVITTFTNADIAANNIQLVQDGSEGIAFQTAASVGKRISFPEAAVITFISINDAPILIHAISEQVIEINQPFQFSIRTDTFSDPEGEPLMYTANLSVVESLPEWLCFYPNTLSFNGTATKEETIQIRITATDTQGATNSANFNLKVVGGDLISINNATTILRNSTTVTGNSSNPIPVVVAITGGVTLLGGCIGAGILYFKKVQDRRTRQQHKFAQLIRHHLKLNGVDNFKSEDGKSYVQAVQTLSNLLYNDQGVDIANMNENRLDELAKAITLSAKNKITPATAGLWKKSKITIEEFEENLKAIVADISRRQTNFDDHETEDNYIELDALSMT